MKILIAEDDAISRRLLQKSLSKWGHEVVATSNGVKALDAFRKDHFPIVITDWMMPEMDGLELVRKIRQFQRPDYVYIIMLTAKSQVQDVVEGMEAGADDFLTKPFDRNELRVRLRAGERVVQLERKLSLQNQELQAVNERMKRDLKAAAEIQKALLPSAPPCVRGIKIEWRFRPSDELAGDILNVFNLDENQIGFYVLDVSGHGVPAALLAVTLSRLLSPILDQASLLKCRTNDSLNYKITPPSVVVNQLNKRFQIDAENGQYFTLVYGILHKNTHVFRYVSAGHPGMVYISRNCGPKILEEPNLPIGFSEDFRYEENKILLKPGDRLYLYSDGIPEAANPHSELFGYHQLKEILKKYYPLPLEVGLDVLLERLESWCQTSKLKDDVSLLALEIEA